MKGRPASAAKEKAAAAHRLFLSLNPEPAVLDRIASVQNRLRAYLNEQGSQLAEGLSWTKPSQIHLTLMFLGNREETEIGVAEAAARPLAQECDMGELSLSGLGCFPLFQRPKVIWLGVRSHPVLGELQQALIKELAARFDLEKTASYPHLTLARVKAVRGKAPPNFRLVKALEEFGAAIAGECIPWRPRCIHLMKSTTASEGVAYHSLCSMPFVSNHSAEP